jgi:hypothetical protein
MVQDRKRRQALIKSVMISVFHKVRGIYSLSEDLLASRKTLLHGVSYFIVVTFSSRMIMFGYHSSFHVNALSYE